MRAYLVVTSIVFVIVTLAHVARVVAEPPSLREPVFLLSSVVSIGLTIWALRLLLTHRSEH